jgi:hypothetical protein
MILVVDRRVDGWTSAPAAPVGRSVSNGARADIQHLTRGPVPCGVTLTGPRRRADATEMAVQGSRTDWWCIGHHREHHRRVGGAALIVSLQARQISWYAHLLRTRCRSDTWRYCCENSHQQQQHHHTTSSAAAARQQQQHAAAACSSSSSAACVRATRGSSAAQQQRA